MSNFVVRSFCAFALAGLLSGTSVAQSPAVEKPSTPSSGVVAKYLRLPLAFERHGAGPGERFIARGQGYSIGIQDGKATIGIVPKADGKTGREVSLEFVRAAQAKATPGAELPGKVNYIHGNDPRKWDLGLPTYQQVTYSGVYPGVDVVYYGNQQQLEFDLVVKPGADASSIRMNVTGGKLSVDPSGALAIGETRDGLKIALPKIYQEVNGEKRSIAGRYVLRGGQQVSFDVESYDRTHPLVIDPTIVYSTLLGAGTNYTLGSAIAVDVNANMLIAGYTAAVDLPVVSAAQASANAGVDAFVSKINAAGTGFIYSTYFGGSGFDDFLAIAVDPTSGAAWLAGQTNSGDFPLLGQLQGYGGNYDAMVVKLSATGTLLFSSYLGGTANESGNGIAVDPNGNPYVTGYSCSSAFPTTAGAFQITSQGNCDAFVVKYSSIGGLVYSTLLGGTNTDVGNAIAVNAAGDAFVTGYTYSSTIPHGTATGAQAANAGGQDAFVAKVNPTGSSLLYFTFFGGAGDDVGYGIVVDASGNAYLAGDTASSDLAGVPVVSGGGTDGFIAKLNATATSLIYFTHVGASRQDHVRGLAIDGAGNAYVTGYTDSANFPSVSALEPAFPGNGVSLFQTTNTAASWSSFDSIGPAVLDVSVDPTSSATIVAVTETGIYRTINSGSSWTQVLALIVGSSSGQLIARSPVTTTTLYVNLSGSVYQSVDNGVTWTFQGSQGLSTAAIVADPSNASTVYEFGSGSFLKSINSGAAWTVANNGIPGTVQSLVGTADGSLYAAVQSSGVYKSVNQGASWTPVNTGLSTGNFSYPHALSVFGSTVYFANGTIYKTVNGGANWTPLQTSVGAGGVFVSPLNASIIYAFTYGGSVLVSADGGVTWSAPGTGLASALSPFSSSIVLDPTSSAHAFVVSPVNTAAFVAKLNAAGTALSYSTFLGGPNYTEGLGIATNGTDAFITGYASSSLGFPLTSSELPSVPADYGAFVTRISDTAGTCAVTLTPASRTATNGFGQTLSFSVLAPAGCAWTASTNLQGATISSGANGSGVGTVSVLLATNSSGATQSGTLTVGAGTATITQPASPCSVAVDQGSYPVLPGGGTVTAIVSAGTGCPWTVSNPYPTAIAINSGASGVGNGTVSLTVSANTGALLPRQFSLSLGNTSINIGQAGSCLGLTPLNGGTVAGAGAVGSVTVTAANQSCSWSAQSSAGWLQITNGFNGTGSGTVNYSAQANNGPARTAFLDIGGLSFTVNQAAAAAAPAPAPGQGEVLTSPRSTTAQPLLFSFVASGNGFDTEITISNTSSDTLGTTPQSGTCALNYYGSGAPTGTQTAFSTIQAGQQLIFKVSQGVFGIASAPNFNGYILANCTFPLARGSAKVVYNAGQPNSATFTEAAQVLTLPRNVPSTQNFLIPVASSVAGSDYGIVISNTSADPFGASGATPTSGACTLNFYGSGAPTPSTGVAVPGGASVSGSTNAFLLSSVAPGFSGYVIAECNFGAVAVSVYGINNFGQANGFAFSETPELISLPRSSTPQPLLFPSVTNQNGNNTIIDLANTSADPFGSTPAGGTCTLNFYGTNAPANPFVTPNIPSGTTYSTLLSTIAPGFQGYVTVSCQFGPVRGLAVVLTSVGAYDYSVTPEVMSLPTSTAAGTLLFPSTTNWNGVDTNITISNASKDSFGTTPASGTCTISYFGAINGTGTVPGAQVSPTIAAGSQYSFALSQSAPGFRGYVIAACGFPQARGVAAIQAAPAGENANVTITTAPAGQFFTIDGNFYIAPQTFVWVKGSSHSLVASTPLVVSGTAYVFGNWSQGGTASQTFVVPNSDVTLTATYTVTSSPVISGVSELGGGSSGFFNVAPGANVTVSGANLATGTASASGVPLQTTLGNVTVKVNGTLAPIFSISPTQVSFQIPYETATGSATIVVNNNGTPSTPTSFGGFVQVTATAPSIYSNPGIQNGNGTPNAAGNQAPPGSQIIAFLTGIGAVTPAVADGAGAPGQPFALPVAAYSATIGGIATQVNFLGLAQGTVGLAQTNIKVPASLATGSYPLVITVGGVASQAATVYVGTAVAALAITSNANFGTWSVGDVQTPLIATGGVPPYTWSISVGSLPAGLFIRTDTPSFFPGAAKAGIIGVATTITPGGSNFTIKVTDSASNTATQPATLTVTGLTIEDPYNLPDGFTNVNYTWNLTTANSTGGVTWAITNNTSLPPGLSLNAGVISGTPTANGFYNFTVSAADSTGTVFRGYNLAIYGPGFVTTPGLGNVIVGTAITPIQIVGQGGTPPYTFASFTPAGLSLSGAGVLTGTPSGGGDQFFYVTITDNAGLSYARQFIIDVLATNGDGGLPQVTVPVADDAYLGMYRTYSNFAVYGGKQPYSWSATGLPPGMQIITATQNPQLGIDAQIAGAPLALGTYSPVVTVTDSSSPAITVNRTFTFTVKAMDSDYPPNPTRGIPYSFYLRPIGGTPPFTWAMTGTLPSGLTLNTSTGVISGTPLENGNFGALFTITSPATSLQLIRQIGFNVNSGTSPQLQINNSSPLADALLNSSYNFQLNACCAAGNVGWSVTNGALPTGLTLNPATGLISGTPTASQGQVTFTVKATDSANASNFGLHVFTINVSPLALSTPTPYAIVNTLYTTAFTASGGTAPYTWVLAPGSQPLPAGIGLSAGGVLSGTPTVTGGFGFNFVVTDSANPAHTFTGFAFLNVYPPGGPHLSITTNGALGTVPIGQLQFNLSAFGGTGNYTWSLASGTLPPGLNIAQNPSGAPGQMALVGVATTPGPYSFSLTVNDGNTSLTQPFTVKITALTVKDINLPDAFLNTQFSYTFTALNPDGNVVFVPTSVGTTGISLNAAGVLSGTPTAPGFYNVNVGVSDGTDTVFRQYQLVVFAVDLTTPGALPNATQGVFYSATLTSSGGAPGAYQYTITGNSLPSGLSLNGGTISGTPNAGEGLYGFAVTVRDSAGNNPYQKWMSIDVVGGTAAQIQFQSPWPVTDAVVGVEYGWQFPICCGGTAPYTWTATGLPPGMSIRSGSGVTSDYIAPGYGEIWGVASTSNTYNVTLTVTDKLGASSSVTFPLHVSVLNVASCCGVPNATINVPYSATYQVIGGSGPYSIAQIAGNLPDGITLNTANTAATGIFTVAGTPIENGNYFNPALKATDGSANTLTLINYPSVFNAAGGITINNGSNLGTVAAGGNYSNQLSACCLATQNYTWTVAGGTSLPSGLTLSPTGLLSGTVTNAGVSAFLIEAADPAGKAAPGFRLFTLNASPITITTNSPLPFGNVNKPFLQNFAATGGTGTLNWTVAFGTYLPPGLTLALNGTLSGTPSATGQYAISIVVTDQNGATAARGYSMSVVPQGQFPVPTFAQGSNFGTWHLGTQFVGLGANGGNGSYTWSLVPPAGQPNCAAYPSSLVPFSSISYISAPDAAGDQLIVGNMNQTNYNAMSNIALPSAANQQFCGSVSLANGSLATAYVPTAAERQGNFSAFAGLLLDPSNGQPFTGGIIPASRFGSIFAWRVSSALPPGMAVRSDALPGYFSANQQAGLIGVATTPGIYHFTLGVTSAGQTSTQPFFIKFSPLDLQDGAPPDGFVGTPFTYTFTPIANAGPVTFTVNTNNSTNRALPPGLTLSGAGVLSGIPTTSGFYTIAMEISDGVDTQYEQYNLYVYDVNVTTPGLLPNGTQYGNYSQNLAATGGAGGYTWKATCCLPAGLTLNTDGTISGTLTGGPGLSNFTVTATGTDNLAYSKNMAIDVIGSPIAPMRITGLVVDDPVFGSHYGLGQNVCCGGTAPFKWTVTGLPPGLTYTASSNSTVQYQSPVGGVLIYGVPQQTGTYNVTYKVTDFAGAITSQTVPMHVSTLDVALPNSNPFTLPNGTINVPYTSTFSVLGGSGPWSFTRTIDGELPDGLSALPPSALTVSGTPLENGGFGPGFLFADAGGNTLFRYEGIQISGGASTIGINGNGFYGYNLGSTPVGVLFSRNFSACCLNNSFVWSVPAGSTLPTGLSLSASGVLSGTPTTPQTYTFLIEAADSTSPANVALKSFVLTVTPIAITTAALPFGDVGVAYNAPALAATGGTGTLTWTQTFNGGSQLPPGLTLNGNGTITGTPTSAGAYNVILLATDGSGNTAIRSYTIDIFQSGPPPLNLLDGNGNPIVTNLGNKAVGPNQLALILVGTGGTPPYHYSITPGTPPIVGLRVQDGQPLPNGFPASGAGGLLGLLGPGTYNTSVRVTDSLGVTFDRAVNFTVLPIDILTFGTLPRAVVGNPYSSFQFTPYGGSGNYTWGSSNLPAGMTLSTTGLLTGTPQSAGSFPWNLSLADAAGGGSVTRTYTLIVSPFAITDNQVLPPATANSAYSHPFSAPNCGTNCKWTVNGGLPAGFSLSGGGVLSGTFTGATGSQSSFFIQASGSAGTTQQDFTLTIPPTVSQALSITGNLGQTSLILGVNSVTPLTASGGTPPYTFTLDSDPNTLPPGMSLLGPGETIGDLQPGFTYLAGRPMQAGPFTFTIRVTDSANNTVAKPFSVQVAAMEILYNNLPNNFNPLIYNTAYSQQMLIVGGTGNYNTWTTSPALIYPGLAVNGATGLITGTPINTGSNATLWTVADDAGNTVTSIVSINVASSAATTVQLFGGPPNGAVLQSFAFYGLSPSGGTGPYTITAPAPLPPGVFLFPDLAAGIDVLEIFPEAAGTLTFTVQVKDANAVIGAHTYSVTVPDFVNPFYLSNAPSLPDGSVGVGYSQSLLGFGSASPVWAVAPGSALPPGLALTAGVISGTPTTAGKYAFVLTLTDPSGSQSFTTTLNISTLAITPTPLPVAILGTTYTAGAPLATMTATGGTTWTASGLPNGLSITPAGLIIGTPTASGQSSVTFTVTDGVSPVSSVLPLFVQAQNPTELDYPISGTTLPDALLNWIYTQPLNLNGGSPPYTWSLTAGSSPLPPGLSIVTATGTDSGLVGAPGTISLVGRPTAAAKYTFSLTATDSVGAQISRTFTLNVTPLATPFFGALQFNSPIVGTPYSQPLTISGGMPPYIYTISAASLGQDMLPPGLSLTPAGFISGTATATGSFNFKVAVTDSLSNTATIQSTINAVAPAPAAGLYVSTPNYVGASVGHPLSQALTVGGGTSTYNWSLNLGVLPPGVTIVGSTMSGVPSVPGTYLYDLRATDTTDTKVPPTKFADRFFTLVVSPMTLGPSIETVMPAATVGSAYSFTFHVAGGTPPYSFTESPFAPLPPGLTLSSAGVVSGTPTQSGVGIVVPVVTDSAGNTLLPGPNFKLTITPAGKPVPLLARTVPVLDDASINVPYVSPLDVWVVGGVAPYTWTVAPASALPAGLGITAGANGVASYLTGIPTGPAGPVSFSLLATDSGNPAQTLTIPFTLNVSPLSLTPDSLAPAIVGTPYSVTFVPGGGAPPYGLSLASFSDLPAGLNFSGGVLSGTPTAPGFYLISLRLCDSSADFLCDGADNIFNKYFALTIDNAAGQSPAISIAPKPINVYYVEGSPNPSVPLTIGTTSGNLAFTSMVSGIPGASLSVASGTTTLNFSGNTLQTAGTYLGLVAVGSPGSVNQGDAVPILLTVAPAFTTCIYSLNPTSATIPAGGGSGSFNINVGPGCEWSVSAPAVTITSAASGEGNATINYSVTPNATNGQINSTITVADQTYSIAQFAPAGCSFGIVPSTVNAPALGGTAQISVNASGPTCAWTATNFTNTLTPPPSAGGTGSGLITIGIQANGLATPLTSTVTIAGQTLTVNQPGANCTVGLSSAGTTMLAAGGTGSVTVTVGGPGTCGYTTVPGPSWISITSGASGTGTGSSALTFTADTNSTTVSRTGTLTIGGLPFTITQQPLACSITTDTSNLGSPFGSGAGIMGSIAVTANGANCAWTAVSNNTFVATVSQSSPTGNGTVTVTTAGKNTSATPITGSVTIGGQTISFTQAGTACSYALRSANGTVPAALSSGSVGIVTASGCAWTPVSDSSWLTVSTPASSGSGDIQFKAATNLGGPQTGHINVAGLVYTVTQPAAPCTYTLSALGSGSPGSPGVPAGGASGSFNFTVKTGGGCTLTPVSYVNWITSVTAVGGTVNYTVQANLGAAERTGNIQAGDQVFTVDQAGNGETCKFSLNSYGAAFGQAGGDASFLATGSGSACSPTPVSIEPSIVPQPPNPQLLGNIFTQPYTVKVFTSASNAVRVATITFGDQIFTVKQTSW